MKPGQDRVFILDAILTSLILIGRLVLFITNRLTCGHPTPFSRVGGWDVAKASGSVAPPVRMLSGRIRGEPCLGPGT